MPRNASQRERADGWVTRCGKGAAGRRRSATRAAVGGGDEGRVKRELSGENPSSTASKVRSRCPHESTPCRGFTGRREARIGR